MMAAVDGELVRRATELAMNGRAVNAASLLSDAAGRGDAEAAMTLGLWRLSGQFIRRDLALSREFLGRAAELGCREAEPVYTALLANGAGGSGRRWDEALAWLERRAAHDPEAQTQLELLQRMAIDDRGDAVTLPPAQPVRTDPEVSSFRDFLSPAECSYVIARAQPLLAPSVVVHPTTGQFIRDPIRSSTNAGFPFVSEDPVLHAINRRIAAATSTSYEQGEPLQVLSYAPGQQYKLHSDAFSGDVNQRVVTFLVYLNADYQGGETFFPDLKLQVRGEPGEGLLFRNTRDDGTPHPLARHAGLPVTQGRKLLLSKWIRARALDLSGPPGRPL